MAGDGLEPESEPKLWTKKGRYTNSRPNDITPNDISPNTTLSERNNPECNIIPNDITPNAT